MRPIPARVKRMWNDFWHKRLLKERGWTQKDFDLHNDPDHNVRATRVKDIYFGYPYVYGYETPSGTPWFQFGDWLEGLTVIKDWCDANCKDKWREDIHRVIKDYWSEWEINELGGGDILFFAFKNEKDYMLFLLRWT